MNLVQEAVSVSSIASSLVCQEVVVLHVVLETARIRTDVYVLLETNEFIISFRDNTIYISRAQCVALILQR